MDEISVAVSNLKNVLLNSDVYKNYLLARKELSVSEFNMLTDYKNKKRDWNGGFEHEKFISNMYANLMLIENTRKFLAAETELVCRIRNICEKIGENLDIDVFA